MRIRVTTRASLFEERKRQHIERGYRIEDEEPVPVNGLCSFIARSRCAARRHVRVDSRGALGQGVSRELIESFSMSLKNPISCWREVRPGIRVTAQTDGDLL